MKKLILILSLSTLIIGTALTVFLVKFEYPKPAYSDPVTKPAITFPTGGLTLNGIACSTTSPTANAQVMNFVNDNVSDEKQTAIWVNKQWLHQIELYFEDTSTGDNPSGIRIYFAKTDPPSTGGYGGTNKVVIVATQGGKQDYFTYDSPSLNTFLNLVAHDTQSTYFQEYHGVGNCPGALFYGSTPPCQGASDCGSTTGNNLPCLTAYNWVKNFRYPNRNTQGIITESEWFSKNFIKGLDQELASDKADGFRIYFAKRADSHKHVFIIVPTGKDNNGGTQIDNFTCFMVENLLGPNDNGEQCPNNCDGVTLPQPQ